MSGLFASVAIFLGGVLNTTAVAAVASWRHPTWPFVGWLLFEIGLGVVRLGILVRGRRAVAAGLTPPRGLAALLSCVWAGSVGFGTFLCITSGDWVLAAIACLSAAAMICGMCLRNFGTPRLAAVMVFSALAPCVVAGLVAREPILSMISIQLPIFMVTILSACFALHRMMVSRISALSDLDHSRSLNETILRSSPDHTLILDQDHRIAFCKRPGEEARQQDPLLGREWLSLLPSEDTMNARSALAQAASGSLVNLITSHRQFTGQVRWFDNVINRTTDGSGRLIVVSRDITHQKKSEEKAIWMAQHDALTGLPNRTLLQSRLDQLLNRHDRAPTSAMLIIDVDNFKAVNDSLGHDAGDALLCAIADRLIDAVADDDLVARTGGDEFALLIAARSDDEIEQTSERIFAQLRRPVIHAGRPIDCGVSIGASLIMRDGKDRSELMKAADIALYAAKAAGRARLRIFKPSMMAEVERHQTMIACARVSLQRDEVLPYYQPKISMRTAQVVGFEALLRWRDDAGELRGPDGIEAAFQDPVLGPLLSQRMFEKVLDDVRCWSEAAIGFGHVAINVTSADFRRDDFAESLCTLLEERGLSPSSIQIEVTENVFLGRGADDVEESLRRLSDRGIRIALDDFGTGYASLSHLSQFPVDVLKIDRSFTQRLGRDTDAAAISATVINLGHCLGMEVVAEGIETAAQEAQLRDMGCDTGQGFFYARPLPASRVATTLMPRETAPLELRRA
ncbi:EAL domain-containing protein [Novosphingobium sp. G106]|uniref:putative bifunctional diguanylate cyclase/phosphodiesterase n=1 Tax=Novosphingobium sp. G106 TaxID=2849500 RepID=UPI001C2D8555|nr:EAL domain-containing protein [Novosphingobium sp. G106]MBV1689515.1 EAL domain-containing protein [Novosphingobium sp. G106]